MEVQILIIKADEPTEVMPSHMMPLDTPMGKAILLLPAYDIRVLESLRDEFNSQIAQINQALIDAPAATETRQ